MQRATIKDVALAAGVAQSTVSNTISGSRYVSQELRERVLLAMKELGYEPNVLARSLRSRQSFTIGVIVPDISNPFHASLAGAIESRASDAGYTVMLCLSKYEAAVEAADLRTLINRQVDGIVIVLSDENTTSSRQYLKKPDVPLVMVDRHTGDPHIDVITSDNVTGGYLAARHLIDLGHRDIGYVTGPINAMPTAERFAGFRRALTEAGIRLRPEWFFHYPQFGFAHAQSTVQRLLGMTDRPTAMCFGNDYMALGAMSALAAAHIRVPDDMSIVGFDDIWTAPLANPPLTTVRQPVQRMGEQSFDLLLDRILDEAPSRGRRLVLEVELIERGSCRARP